MFSLIRARANWHDFKFVLIFQTVYGTTMFAFGYQLAVDCRNSRFSWQASVRFAKRLKHCIFYKIIKESCDLFQRPVIASMPSALNVFLHV